LASLRYARWRVNEAITSESPGATHERRLDLTRGLLAHYDARLMSAGLPESIDVWRAAAGSRLYAGQVALTRLTRLLPSLVDGEGSCEFQIAFMRDAGGQALARVSATAELPLLCQRSLERFLLPVQVEQTLGLLRNEADEAALLPEVEPVLVPENGMMRLLDLLEDELILVLPVLPVRPGTEPVDLSAEAAGEPEPEDVKPNPFAALAALRSSD